MSEININNHYYYNNQLRPNSSNSNKSFYFEISFPLVISICCVLPLAALFFCIVWSLTFDFYETTSTICHGKENVKNYFPSVSVATGLLTPQRYIWRFAIAVHLTPRFLIAYGYYTTHQLIVHGRNKRRLSALACTSHMVEIFSLAGLSFISSTENFEMHKYCFISFMLSATIHMITLCFLYYLGSRGDKLKDFPLSLKLKLALLVVNLFAFCMALWLYDRHNTHCEDGVYSLFGICEVVVIATNVFFHSTAVLDFSSSQIALVSASV